MHKHTFGAKQPLSRSQARSLALLPAHNIQIYNSEVSAQKRKKTQGGTNLDLYKFQAAISILPQLCSNPANVDSANFFHPVMLHASFQMGGT